jgi:translocation and assembly module TamB
VSGHEAQQMDLTAKLGTLYVQSKDINLEITANTQVKTGPSGQPAVSGTVVIRRGHIMINDQRFEFDRARIMFDGSEEINPGLDIQISHEYPEVTAIVEVHGTLKHPELRFTSDPPIYDQSGVIGLIMTGGAVGGDPSASQFNAEAAVTNALLGALADNIAPALGLDVLRIGGQQAQSDTGAQGDTDTRVEVGKYLSPRVYLSFVHVFGAPENDNTNEAQVEYRMTRHWVMQTAFGDAGVGGVDFLWTYRY